MNAKKLRPSFLSRNEIVECNQRIMTLMSTFLNLSPNLVDPDTIKTLCDEYSLSPDRAYAECLAVLCSVDASGKDKAFFNDYFLPMISCLDVNGFTSDEYYRTVRVSHTVTGNWELKTMTLAPYEAFVCGDPIVTPDLRLIPRIAFFTEKFDYPALLENGREWMTLLPNETVTTLPAVKRAHGKVLTYGLGLGYFAFMASNKDDVASVTVVELSRDAIEVFTKYILPFFPHADKIRIINRDAFDYAETEMKGYDSVFTDIWHDAGDGKELYLKMKRYEDRCPGAVFDYWIEDTIRCCMDKRLWTTQA